MLFELPLDIKKYIGGFLHYDKVSMEYFRFLHETKYKKVINEMIFLKVCYDNNIDMHDNTWKPAYPIESIEWDYFPIYALHFRDY